MAFEGLTEKLSAAFKKLRGKGRVTEADVTISILATANERTSANGGMRRLV